MTPAAAAKRDAFFARLATGPQLMGILNVTPDSFSDGGRFTSQAAARTEVERHAAGGAAIIDVGAESTRPGCTPVDAALEMQRLAPVFETLIPSIDLAVSIDTTKASIAAAALAAGTAVVNDQWGLQGDPAMADTVAAGDAGLVMMHNRSGVDPASRIVDELRRFFERSLRIAEAAGIPRDRIILDPGIGFGKTPEQNLAAMSFGVAELRSAFDLPVLIGASRKSLFKALVGATCVNERLAGTLAAHLAAYGYGAGIFRVHDCRDHHDAFAVTRAMSGYRIEEYDA